MTRIYLTALFTFLLPFVSSAGSLRTNDAQQFLNSDPVRNYVKNSGAETNVTAGITDADSILTRDNADTPVIMGDFQFEVDADASGEKACWALDTLQGEVEGNAMGSFMFRGDASLYKTYVYNDTDSKNASNEVQLTNSSQTQIVDGSNGLSFVADPAKTYELCIEATDNAAAAFVVDALSVGRNTGLGTVDQAEVVLSATRASTSQTISSTSETTLIWNSALYDPSAGLNTATGVYTVRKSGRLIVASSIFLNNASVESYVVRIKKGSTTYCSFDNSAVFSRVNPTCELDAVVGDTISITIDSTSDASYDFLNGTTSTLSITRFPSASEQVAKMGAPFQEITSYTPGGAWTNTTYTGAAQCIGGGKMWLNVRATATGTPAGNLDFTLPSGYTIDTTGAQSIDGSFGFPASVLGVDNGVQSYPGLRTLYVDSNTFAPASTSTSGSFPSGGQRYTSSAPFTVASGDFVEVTTIIPVNECPRTPAPLLKQSVVYDDTTVRAEGNDGSTTIEAGTYTPTMTNTTNIASSTAQSCTYLRIGQVVNVNCPLLFTCTAGSNTPSLIEFSLPVASNLTAQLDLNGVMGSDASGTVEMGRVRADTSNDRGELTFFCNSTSDATRTIQFGYEVK